jgi:Cu-Zn family superoxide dismutase
MLRLSLVGALVLSIAAAAGAAENAIEVPVNSISAEGIGKQVGTLTLAAVSGGVSFTPHLRGFAQGAHAFHVHQKPDCGAGMSEGRKVAGLAAGPHYSGAGGMSGHGQMAMAMRGDLPELMATPDGSVTRPVVKKDLTLAELHGRSLMIHVIHEYGEQPPDPAKPKGGGARVACAVIP